MSGPRRARTDSPSPPPAPPAPSPAPSPAPPGPLAEEAIGFAFGRSPAPGPPPKVVPSSSNARLPTHRTNPPETSRSNHSPECTASPPTRQPIHPSAHAPPRGNTPAPQLTAPHSASCRQQQHTDRYFYGILSWHARFNKTPASRHTRFAILANGPQGCPTKPALLFPARGRVSDDPRAFFIGVARQTTAPDGDPDASPPHPTRREVLRTLPPLTPRNARLSRRSTGSFRPAPLAPKRAKPQSSPEQVPAQDPAQARFTPQSHAHARARSRPRAATDTSPHHHNHKAFSPAPNGQDRPPSTAHQQLRKQNRSHAHRRAIPRQHKHRASIRPRVPPPPIGDSSARQTRAARHAH